MDWFVWLGLIFCSGYYFSITSMGSFLVIPILVLMVLAFLLRGNIKRRCLDVKVKKNKFIFYLFLSSTIIIPSIINGNFGLLEIKYLLVLTCSLLITRKYSFSYFKTFFVKLMIIITIFAFAGYLLSITSLINRFPVIYNYNGVAYVNGILFSAIKYTYSGITNRIQGVFWEPGLFATYVALALLFVDKKMFEKKSTYYLILVLFVIGLVLSRSGAGIIMLLLLLVIKLLDKKENVKLLYTFLIVGLYAIILFFFFSTSSTIGVWLEKYLFSKVNDASNVSNLNRVNSIILDFIIFSKKFPFGTGLSRYSYEVSLYRSTYPSSCTSTLTTFLASMGILGVPYFTYWVRGILKLSHMKSLVVRMGVLLLLLIIVTKEPHGNLLILNCIIAYSNFRLEE